MFVAVDQTNLLQAATVHAISWRESHRSFCPVDFVDLHTPERQREYMLKKLAAGSRFYLLVEDDPIGVVSVSGCLIEDLYILPDKQGMGYGTALLRFAIGNCTGTPTLWVLENNVKARRLYRRMGFRETGAVHTVPGGFDEIELALT